MKKVLIAALVFTASTVGASAATVSNTGGAAETLVVVEGGSRMEVAVDPGQSQTICPAGCFVTLPNGDRVGLEGGETLELKDGVATIR